MPLPSGLSYSRTSSHKQPMFLSIRVYVMVSIFIGALIVDPALAFMTTRTPHPVECGTKTARRPTFGGTSSQKQQRVQAYDKHLSMRISRRTRQSTTRAHAVALPAIQTTSIYLGLLAIQFGIQPILTKAFTPQGIIRSTVIMAQDFVRFTTCFLALRLSGNWSIAVQGWTWQGSLMAAGIPSVLYLVQNYFTLIAYQALQPVTFNILNQTKTLSAALCCYLILGRRQSPLQIGSLFLLLLSALVIEKMIPLPGAQPKEVKCDKLEVDHSSGAKESSTVKVAAGVIPILIASFISGLAGAVSQKNLQVAGRDVCIFSMELSAISLATMASTLMLGSPDGKELRKSGMAKGWTWKTWIPVFTNAVGGVIVGIVTKHSGAVRKGFALIFGLLLSGILQSRLSADQGITKEQICGGVLASISVWMHSR